MDAIEALLLASESVPTPSTRKKSSLLGPLDAIMLLADQAAIRTPLEQSGGFNLSCDDLNSLHCGKSANGGSNRRPRAQSEPWLVHESRRTSSPAGTVPTSALSSKFRGGTASAGASKRNRPRSGSAGDAGDNEEEDEDGSDGSGSGGAGASAEFLMGQYSSIYNTNGRIGIYTKEERAAIIQRFREKRRKRVWKKKVRYFCRKNLADTRVRVKGRFVKLDPNAVASATANTAAFDTSETMSSTIGDKDVTATIVASSVVTAAAEGELVSKVRKPAVESGENAPKDIKSPKDLWKAEIKSPAVTFAPSPMKRQNEKNENGLSLRVDDDDVDGKDGKSGDTNSDDGDGDDTLPPGKRMRRHSIAY